MTEQIIERSVPDLKQLRWKLLQTLISKIQSSGFLGSLNVLFQAPCLISHG